ncbi:hypothetical protein BBP40_003586 [Aspergillus hancockii]|nr:hypothetical protein BBP40_003586 [Aspergillus hancockii]
MSFYRIAQAYFIGLALLSFVSAFPFPFPESSTNVTPSNALSTLDEIPVVRPRDQKPFTLRIMPLGASITYGLKSTDGNGYRRWLRQQLRSAGWWVNMVGSRPNGTMNDNESEAKSGDVVNQVAERTWRTIPQQPNLILINAGTNDANDKDEDNVSKTGERMNALLTHLFDAIPGTTIILSTLLTKETHFDHVVTINEQYRQIVAARRQLGQRIVLAEMSQFIKLEELVDGTHPNDYGYKKMASVWWAAIQEAERESLLQPPNDTGVSDTKKTTCEKVYGSGGERVQTQLGSGSDDGNYVHNSQDMGRIFSPATTKNENDFDTGINYAQLVNKFGAHREEALDELVWTKDGDGTYMFINNNDGKFGDAAKIDVKDGCLAKGVRWGDVNNDGLDDFICISREGHMYVSINEGVDEGGIIPSFRSIGLVKDKPDEGLGQDNVRLGDIDGDGRIDYCLIHNNGDIRCWRNGGHKDAPTKEYGGYWQDLGIVFTGTGMGDITGVRFVDINGDFRSDWLWLDDKGKVTTYINNRGTGKSLVPDWHSAGVTHAGMGTDGAKNRIKFGRVYAGGGADYTWIESIKQPNSDDWKHYAHVWKNTGHGGTMLKGRGYLYGNIHEPPVWEPEGIEIFNVNKDRKSLHLADFDGDRKCDLWAVDRDTGKAEVWLNKWSDSAQGGFFEYKGVITGNAKCAQGWGVGLSDLGLRFADLDGDGRADYLCMDLNGRTDGWLNKGENNFQSIGQIKQSENYDRANHRWADVNGDRLVDFLWVDKFSGDTKVWINQGPVPTLDSKWKWEVQGPRYMGADRGANMHFPNLGGLGRADYHQVIPRTNIAYTWFSKCPSDGLDDDDNTQDPRLPPFTAAPQPGALT